MRRKAFCNMCAFYCRIAASITRLNIWIFAFAQHGTRGDIMSQCTYPPNTHTQSQCGQGKPHLHWRSAQKSFQGKVPWKGTLFFSRCQTRRKNNVQLREHRFACGGVLHPWTLPLAKPDGSWHPLWNVNYLRLKISEKSAIKAHLLNRVRFVHQGEESL